MKCRKPMSKEMKRQCDDYVQQEVDKRLRDQQLKLIMRTMKLAIAALRNVFGFGNIRVMRFIEEFNKLTNAMNDDFTGWYKIDEIVIDECGVRCDREDYDALEEAWMLEHKRDKNVRTMEESKDVSM